MRGLKTIHRDALRAMANSKSLATIGFVAFSGSMLGILLGLYLVPGFGLHLG